MIVDCFPFFNELDLLEIRLHELSPWWISSSCPKHASRRTSQREAEGTGVSPDHKNRFRDFPIEHVVVDAYYGCGQKQRLGTRTVSAPGGRRARHRQVTSDRRTCVSCRTATRPIRRSVATFRRERPVR